MSADRARHLAECLASLREPGAPAQVVVVPYGDPPVAVPDPAPPGGPAAPAVAVLDAVGTLDAARAAGLAAAEGAAIGFLAPTDTALPGYAARAGASLDDAPLVWTPAAHGGGPLARVAAAPPRLSDAVIATDTLRAQGWPTDSGLVDAALPVLARLDAAAAPPAATGEPWARWERRDHALGFGFAPDLAGELDPWLAAADVAWDAVASTPVRAAWAARLVAGLDPYLAQVEELDDAQWQRVRAAYGRWGAALDRTGADGLGVWARAALHLVNAGDRAAVGELVEQRSRRPEDLRTQVVGTGDAPVVLAAVPGGEVALTAAETPAWASLRRTTWQDGPTGGLVLALACGIRHVDLADHPPEVEVALVPTAPPPGTSSAPGAMAPGAYDVPRHLLRTAPAPDEDGARLSGLRYVDQRPGGRTALLPADLLATLDGSYTVEVTVRAGGVARTTRITDAELRGSAGEPVVGTDGERTLRAAWTPDTGLRIEVTAGPPEPPPAPASGAVDDVRLTEIPDLAGAPVPSLVVTGHGAQHRGRSLELVGAGRTVPLRTTWQGDDYEATTDLRHPWVGAGIRLLPPAAYRLRWSGTGERAAPPTPRLLADLPRELTHPRARLEVRRTPQGTTAIVVAPPLSASERGPFAQQQLIDTYLRADERGIALDPELVYFQSFTGQSPTDSPAAIHAELRRRAPHLRTVWGVADGSVEVPEGADAVLMGSAAWYDVLARAGHLVINIEVEPWFRLRAGQRLLQTFHGYPSKSMGLDLWRAKRMPPAAIRRRLARSRETWSALLTPAPEMNRHYREQYAYEGPIIDVGYPRDDALLAPDAGARRDAARAALGLRPEQIAVLHAPTWRDDSARNHRVADGAGVLDPARLAADLGAPYVVLQRAHRFHPEVTERAERVIDVSDHPEVNDLILASDAAVLDYSSLRFDYALTGKPMVFCVPDLETYTHEARGFLFPYAESAPGPWCDTHAEVVAALRDLDGIRRAYAEQLAAFNDRFHPIRDGRAAARVVDAFFADLLSR